MINKKGGIMDNIIVTGGTGFVGRSLITELLKKDPAINKIYILTRGLDKAKKKFDDLQDKIEVFSDFKEIDKKINFKYAINLAGEPIADKRWSVDQKAKLRQSRIETTKELVEFLTKLSKKPKALISASAVGYYGSQGYERLDEDSEAKEEFTHFLCKDWENETLKAEKHGIRVCITRFGVILGKDGGALKKMITPFKMGLGGKIASGEQIMSWIHLRDVVRGITFLLYNKNLKGKFNFCAPNAVSNRQFTVSLAKAVSRPAFFDMPLFVVKLLFGEMGEILLTKGQNVYPRALLNAGFNFKYRRIDSALRNIVN